MTRRATTSLGWLSLTTFVALAGCGTPAASSAVALEAHPPERLETVHLPNAVRIHSRVISGGQPEGEAGFAELARLGIRTVISVDGAQPDLKLAHKYGLRYVHLPHGYDGVPQPRARELAKAVRELPGPIYIHCHHGKHRSPAAAATACVTGGLIPASGALEILKLAGTNPKYRGLFASAESAQPADLQELDHWAVEFREAVQLPPLAQGMVELEHVHNRLQAIAAASWRSPPSYPDLDPAHEALLLREHYTEMLRTEAARREPSRFRELLQQGEQAGQSLEDALRAWQQAGGEAPIPAGIAQHWQQINQGCAACHQEFRDVPLAEKRQAGP